MMRPIRPCCCCCCQCCCDCNVDIDTSGRWRWWLSQMLYMIVVLSSRCAVWQIQFKSDGFLSAVSTRYTRNLAFCCASCRRCGSLDQLESCRSPGRLLNDVVHCAPRPLLVSVWRGTLLRQENGKGIGVAVSPTLTVSPPHQRRDRRRSGRSRLWCIRPWTTPVVGVVLQCRTPLGWRRLVVAHAPPARCRSDLLGTPHAC